MAAARHSTVKESCGSVLNSISNSGQTADHSLPPQERPHRPDQRRSAAGLPGHRTVPGMPVDAPLWHAALERHPYSPVSHVAPFFALIQVLGSVDGRVTEGSFFIVTNEIYLLLH